MINEQEKHRIKSIKELEILASEVLKLKQEREQRRPLLIEFCGSPKAGKSTTISALNIFLKRNGFKTIVLTERASISPIENKLHPYFNIWTLTSAIAEIVKHLSMGVGKVDIIISDRGIFDALSWFHWLNENPKKENPYLDDKTFNDLQTFVLMDMWRDSLDIVYIFTVKPETSIKREYSNLLTEKRGTIMTEQVLGGFNSSILKVKSLHGDKFRNVQIIETDIVGTEDAPNKVGYLVTNQILVSLKDLLIEKIGYFSSEILNKLKFGVNSIDIITNESLLFGNRDIVEKENYIQPIAIVVITNSSRDKVLVVKKGTKRTSENSPERNKLLTYIGGHIRIEDLRDSNISTLIQTLHREVYEEIGESLNIQQSNPFLIYTPDNDVSKKHLAVCFSIEMDLDDRKFKLVSDEFIMKTGTSKSGHVLKISDVIHEKVKIENWSRIILNHIFGKNLTILKKSTPTSMFEK